MVWASLRATRDFLLLILGWVLEASLLRSLISQTFRLRMFAVQTSKRLNL